MGKGDKKSRRGKIILGSYGVRRPRSSKSQVIVKAEATPVEKVVKIKKAAEKPAADPKPKVKVAEIIAETESNQAVAPKKEVKKAVKKTKNTEEAEKV